MRLYIHLKNTQSNDDRNGFCSSHNRQFVYRHRVPHTGILSKIVPLLQPQRVKFQNFETLWNWSLSDSGAHVSHSVLKWKWKFMKIVSSQFSNVQLVPKEISNVVHSDFEAIECRSIEVLKWFSIRRNSTLKLWGILHLWHWKREVVRGALLYTASCQKQFLTAQCINSRMDVFWRKVGV